MSVTTGAGGVDPVPRLRATIPRPLVILLGLAGVTLAVAGMRETAWLIAPTFLGIILVVLVSPVRVRVERLGAPIWLGAVVTILLVYLIIVALVGSVVLSFAQLAQLVPEYAPEMANRVDDAGGWLSGLGLPAEQVDATVAALDPGKVVGLLTDLASGVFNALAGVAFIATLVLFIGVDAGRFPRSLFAARLERPGVVDALTSFAKGTRVYLTVSAVFGLIVAVIDAVVLSLLGIPGAFVWGVLAFVTNFIPNIGFVIGVIPPAIIGLLEGGPSLMLAVIALYSVINVVIQSIIQPKFQADALGLTTTLTFLSLVFWAWVLGPLGALLALPLTLLVKALLVDVDPHARWLGPLLSGVDDTEPETVRQPVGAPAESSDALVDPHTTPAAGDTPAAPPNEPRR